MPNEMFDETTIPELQGCNRWSLEWIKSTSHIMQMSLLTYVKSQVFYPFTRNKIGLDKTRLVNAQYDETLAQGHADTTPIIFAVVNPFM